MNSMIKNMEIVAIISSSNFLFQKLHVHQSPTIKFFHFRIPYFIGCIIKIIGVAKNKADCITNFTINFRKLFQNFFGNTYICFVI